MNINDHKYQAASFHNLEGNTMAEDLDPFIVTYIEKLDGKWWGEVHWYFECMAEDADHAREQCMNANPDCIIIEVEWRP